MGDYRSFAVKETGISHKKHVKKCQDFAHEHEDTGVVIAIVADGHGNDNCFRSDNGAKFAVVCATEGIREFVKYLDESEEDEDIPRKKNMSKEKLECCLRERLIKYGIIQAWFKMAAEDFTKNPVTAEELEMTGEKYREKYSKGQDLHHAYGATLIAAAITEDYWFGIHIGDGRLTALYPDGTFDQPVPWDEKCYLNVTTSICDDDASERARFYVAFHEDKTPPVAVFLCTDGVDDNYPVDENEKHLFKLYRTIAITFAEDGFESTDKQLKDLANSFATKGKGDDTSIAGFIDMEVLKKVVPIWQKQIAEEEAEAAAEKNATEETNE
jgi:serine/threonine protein phosphatase PrpC